ncbi:cytochrome c oxidase assembly protein [Enterovirga sp.]|uniref:cytochrome c oxidase assembly protein n=1 Tax=Enterovirga sp. TaxID=2026350 RepID=UPI002631F867|nr:cytochrome c oxidase assembly protein [Enterovirga sp.]MDB5590779.1 hypothetical protein [Enterovirga sp.]
MAWAGPVDGIRAARRPAPLLGLALWLGALSAGPAVAHGYAPIGPAEAWRFWSLDPLATVPLLAGHLLYGRGMSAFRRRLGHLPRALPGWRVTAFLAGELMLVVALLSPVDAVAETILSAHMLQHVILIAAAPPLLVLGRPEIAWAAGTPGSWRPVLLGAAARPIYRAVGWLARPLPATLLHGAALWLWHVPALFELGRGDGLMHAFEHLCFFGTALLFWRAVIGAAATPRRALVGMAAALATLVHGGFLSALISFAREPLYPGSTMWAPIWGMTPLQDQELAGAIMWVPAGAAYLAAGLALAARLLSRPNPTGPAAAHPPALAA